MICMFHLNNPIEHTLLLSHYFLVKMDDDDDFEAQLQLEALERQKAENGGSSRPNPYLYTDPNDGTVYEWNHEKQAWFPKIDENFIATYHANYQYQSSTTEAKQATTDVVHKMETEQPRKAEKRKASDPCWFEVDDAHNTNVYVTGLPPNTTEEEFIELMSKCGLIMKDPDTNKYKIKLYRNEDGSLKGDGRCCYIKIESVGLALDILDGSYFKNKIINVERAQFQLKGAYDPTKKPKKKKTKEKEKLKKKLDKLFDWRPDKLRGMRTRNEKTVIIKNMFHPKEFEEDAALILEYQKDVREECSKCGEVKKVVVYDRNPEGVVAVTFAEPEMADECIKLMNGRWFAARQLTAETWDGKTRYKIVETEEERGRRLKEWENFLQGNDKRLGGLPSDNSDSLASHNSPDYDEKDKQDDYEMAGDTDSSGTSDAESDQISSSMGPVMSSSGSFAFSQPQFNG